ncbi:hypothetical protein MPTK1_4g13850 [Marchantia polymorpha subsp. ruderalis]|uniref:Uncharacterized protein n=2 Tax=Marchantia polymorpha TaxID=3197 RepID=A0AAF6B9N1_MARPO|nr:hypothetical protein MARPO_0070s0096 [Marchantia polymorpha]BBN08715.1 hypothetical protein Mp_4g13850 [Marchantia polymorpha subsp. ruderalis]|eukprot:PTQ35639.1 hypothetical protein MARPO_0070s0096 [Marchantia polymorpha]
MTRRGRRRLKTEPNAPDDIKILLLIELKNRKRSEILKYFFAEETVSHHERASPRRRICQRNLTSLNSANECFTTRALITNPIWKNMHRIQNVMTRRRSRKKVIRCAGL